MSLIAMGVLPTFVAMLLAVVILAPVALSSQDLITWAGAPGGLDLARPWPVLVFIGLDAAGGVCVLLAVYCAWRGEPAGIFGILVWCFALGSAFANFPPRPPPRRRTRPRVVLPADVRGRPRPVRSRPRPIPALVPTRRRPP